MALYTPCKPIGIVMLLLALCLAVVATPIKDIEEFDIRASADGFESRSFYPAPNGGWASDWAESYRKATAIVANLTLAEKVNITTGTGFNAGRCAGNTGSIPRVGIPQLCLQDGPLGVRSTQNNTVFPAGITVGATFDKDLMYRRGVALGEEFRGKGINFHLGPSVGALGRKPRGGRNWEGFGSDPVLQGIAGAETIKGVQSQGVIATVKHYIANEQEIRRMNFLLNDAYSSDVNDRDLHELYLWPFAEAVRAGAGAVMTAYNAVNGSATSQNAELINGLLKDELGFQGIVMTDWLAHMSGVASALAGLDMSMPGDGGGLLRGGPSFGKSYWGYELTRAALNGSVPMSRINDMATRIIATWFQLGQDNDYPPPNFSAFSTNREDKLYPFLLLSPTGVVNEFVDVQADHATIAREVAQDAITLLKNDNNTLPLSSSASLFVFGDDAQANPDGINSCGDFKQCNKGTLGQGWGSGTANYPYFDAPIDALRRRIPSVTYSSSNTFPSNLSPSPTDIALVFINSASGENLADQPVELNFGDRSYAGLSAWYGGDQLVINAAQKFSTVIVIIHTVGPTLVEPWISLPSVKAVLNAHLPGQEAGESLTRILFGDVSPSGHLPYTIARQESDYGSSVSLLQPLLPSEPHDVFSEGLLIDYRHFQSLNITPRYAFGHGLSYTTFTLSSTTLTALTALPLTPFPAPPPSKPIPQPPTESRPSPEEATAPAGFSQLPGYIYPWLTPLSAVSASTLYSNTSYPYPPGYAPLQRPTHPPAGGSPGGNLDLFTPILSLSTLITNTGSRPGRAVAQLYVSYPADLGVPVPVLQLRGFEKTRVLGPGESQRVEIGVRRKDLSFWDTEAGNWRVGEVGGYTVWVGWASDDLRVGCRVGGECEGN